MRAIKLLILTTPIAQKVKKLLQTAQAENIHTELYWVPGHTNVEGNEEVVTADKKVAKVSTEYCQPETFHIQI